MRIVARAGLVVASAVWCVSVAAPAAAQTTSRASPPAQAPVMIGPPPPPATLMEAFNPAAGSVVTLGFDDLGDVKGIDVNVRELRDARGGHVRGLVVAIGDGAGVQQSFVDADEIRELLTGFDALLAINANPTPFSEFEVSYATKGELTLTASSTSHHGIVYSVNVGRLLKTRRDGLSAFEMHQLRTLFESASQKLATLPADR
jgi:hypothetical protein